MEVMGQIQKTGFCRKSSRNPHKGPLEYLLNRRCTHRMKLYKAGQRMTRELNNSQTAHGTEKCSNINQLDPQGIW